MGRVASTTSTISRRRFARIAGSSSITITSVKKRSIAGASSAARVQAGREVHGCRGLGDARPDRDELLCELDLGRLAQQRAR